MKTMIKMFSSVGLAPGKHPICSDLYHTKSCQMGAGHGDFEHLGGWVKKLCMALSPGQRSPFPRTLAF